MSDDAFRSRSADPMREVDLILLEDALMRRNLETSRTAVGVQTACMTLLALFLFGLFLYSVTHRESMLASASVVSPSAHSTLPMP